MAADESALVPVAPDDTVDSILKKIHGTGAATIQLLVPDDTGALQAPRGFERLRRALDADGIDLLVISSDDQTLDAARRNQIETVGVQGTRVLPAAPSPSDRPDRYATQVLPATPLDASDAAFLDALDQVPADDRYADLRDEDAELYDALDDLSDTTAVDTPYERWPASADDRALDDDDFAAGRDSWSDVSDADTVAASTPLRGERDYATGGARRYSAADIDLTDDDVSRQRGSRRASANRARADMRAATARGVAGGRRSATAGRRYDDDEGAVAPRRRSTAAVLLPLAVVALLALALIFWLLSSRVTVAVAPPAVAASEHPFENEVIPLAASGSSETNTAVQASPVTADAEATVTGQVMQETQAPTGTARGEVTIINTIGNAVPIPAGSEFIATNDAGQEVRFLLDNDVTVPGATTTSSITGSSTTYGQTTVTVTARSPGSASNVPQNSIRTLLIPGQQPIVTQNSNFIFQNGPIGGGSEAPQRVVTEAEVQAVLQEALTQLYNNGLQALSGQIDESSAGIDPDTVSPSAAVLGSPENYEIVSIQPPIGQTVDPANPTFTVAVRASFSALATPRDQPVTKQLETVAPQHFAQRADRPCEAGEEQGTRIDDVEWNGERLTIDAVVTCTPAGGLPPETIARVEDAIRGKPREAAEAGLRALEQQGLIGAYDLPAGRESFPRFDWLIDVEVRRAQPAEPTPTGAPAPTTQPLSAQGAL